MNKKAFTLIEIMISIVVFSIIIIGGFKAYSGVLVGKIKLMEGTNIQKQAFYFSEKFFEEIKKGGTIDYEEYFNRKVVGTNTGSGHYSKLTGFGNYGINGNIGTNTYGDGFYYCRSDNGSRMTGTGCLERYSAKIDGTNVSVGNNPQRYGQYSFHFIDYNSNYDSDLGDEDGDGKIIGDDDDEYLGLGPTVFSGSEVKEIYLISADKRKRTFFRYNVFPDEGSGGLNRGTIEILKLEGKDWGFDHDTSNFNKKGEYDGIIDTWLINKDFSGGNEIIAGGSNDTGFWQPLFGKNINVLDVKFFVFPSTDKNLAWKNLSSNINISPYIRIQMTLSPSFNAKKGFKGKIPKIKINTTINLTDIYSR